MYHQGAQRDGHSSPLVFSGHSEYPVCIQLSVCSSGVYGVFTQILSQRGSLITNPRKVT